MSLTFEKTKYEHVALDDKGVPIIMFCFIQHAQKNQLHRNFEVCLCFCL